MKENSLLRTIIVCMAAIACVLIMRYAVVDFKTTNRGDGLTATGSASSDFESDLIVWRGSFSSYAYTTAEAYEIIKSEADAVRKYLLDNGVTEDEFVFDSVDISTHYRESYDDEGNYIGSFEDGYDLWQQVSVTSRDVDKVERISRDISKLIENGVDFMSCSPEYYCTTLDEVKLELIQKATDNARQRIEIMAQSSGCELGELLTANLGVFQITATNSGTNDYTYDGAFDTSSRYKTATITVRLNYAVK